MGQNVISDNRIIDNRKKTGEKTYFSSLEN